MSSYMDNIREITSRVSMGFYGNSSEDFGEVFINREGWAYNSGTNEVSAPSSDWMLSKRNQIVTYGMKSQKYAVLDGSTALDGTSSLVDTSVLGITGLASDVYADGTTGYFTGKKPTITHHYTMSREFNQIMLIGNHAMDQYPVEYDIILYDISSTTTSQFDESFMPDGSQTHYVRGVQGTDGGESILTFSVTGGAAVEQIVCFQNSSGQEIQVETIKATLVIKKWSKPGAIAKIMYFSRDINMNILGNEILSISVLEEKASDVSELSYGISSNTCSIEVKDTNHRFSSNADLMKKNKLVRPYIAIKSYDSSGKVIEPTESDYEQLGMFYTDSWEMSSDSDFVTCKAYDILYGLQSINLDIPYKKQTTGANAGKYAADTDVTVAALLAQIIEASNEQKKAQEIYGVDIEYEIDPALKSITIPYVLLERKSAWDILQDIANFALCFIYTDRQGKVYVTCDAPPSGMSNIGTPIATASISPSNSFSYSIPLQSKCVVNRVKMPYHTRTEGKLEDDVIEIKSDAIQTVGTKFIVTVDLSNVHFVYDNIELWAYIKGSDMQSNIYGNDAYMVCCKHYYDQLYLELQGIDITGDNPIEILINQVDSSDRYSIEDLETTLDASDKIAIKVNGVCEFSAEDSIFMFGKDLAEETANRILNKYQHGITYTETEWTGSPDLHLSDTINCSSKYEYDSDSKTYVPSPFECFSNDITLDGGLRMATKLRKL